MKQLGIYLREYRKESILAPLFKLLEAFFDLLVPLVVAQIIDVGIAGNNKTYIISRVVILVLLALAGLLSSFTAQWFAAKASAGFGANLRQATFDHIESLSYSQLDKLGTSTLITRLTSDINQAQTGLNMGLRLLLRSPFIVFGSMVMAFTINVRAALVFVVTIPILAIVVYGIMIISIPLFRKAQAGLDEVTGLTRENLTGVRVIRAFCKEADEVRAFDEKNEALTHLNEFVGRLSALMNPLTYVLINIATIVLIRTGAVQVNLGHIQQGDVVALYNYMAQMVVELVKLASLIITINKAVACADRVAQVLAVPEGMEFPAVTSSEAAHKGEMKTYQEGTSARGEDSKAGTVEIEPSLHESAAFQMPGESASAVSFRGVSMEYADAGDESLTDISFDAKKGQTIGVIGGTGSGKSTLVNLIPRFYDVSRGAVLVDGVDVRQYPKGALIEKIGVVPQKAMLFAGTVRDNMRWGNEAASDDEIWHALSTAQAKDVVEGKEGGLDFQIEQSGRNLSGGQKQRLTIARALVKRPEILIMDDSASALDFATDAALRKAVRSFEGNMTTFIVSQRASSIMQADQILVLDDGRLAGKGTHEELMKSCETYREIYYSQFPERRPSSAGQRPELKEGALSDGDAVSAGQKSSEKGMTPDKTVSRNLKRNGSAAVEAVRKNGEGAKA
ncbi:MAG: ABC transporter ATP-binding protein [Chordicoccus sp.]